MSPSVTRPSPAFCRKALEGLAGTPLTYWERGATDWSRMPAGYEHATERVSLGYGEGLWAFAKTLVDDWTVYPQTDWVGLSEYPIVEPGAQVMVLVEMWGTWWTSPCRVVYVVDEPDRYGFAYGTLDGHVECGEELFVMRRDAETGEVSYEIRVMARASHVLAKALPPVVTYMQRRFRRAAFAQVLDATTGFRESGTAVTPALHLEALHREAHHPELPVLEG